MSRSAPLCKILNWQSRMIGDECSSFIHTSAVIGWKGDNEFAFCAMTISDAQWTGKRDLTSLLPLPSSSQRPFSSPKIFYIFLHRFTPIHHTKHHLHSPLHPLQLRSSRYLPSSSAFPHITFPTALQDEVLHSSRRAARRRHHRAGSVCYQCLATMRCSSQSTFSILTHANPS